MAKRSGKFYRKNEADVMKQLGLEPTKNSGSGWIEKEDGQNDYVIAQLKSTDAKSIRVQLNDIHTLEYNAVICHKIPIFVIQFLETNEIFIQMKPEDIINVAQYLELGSCKINSVNLIEIDDIKPTQTKIIKSGDRDSFWKEKEEQYAGSKNTTSRLHRN